MAKAPPLRCPECGREFAWDGSDGPGLNPHYNRAKHVEQEHMGGQPWTFDRQTAPWYYVEERGWAPGKPHVGKAEKHIEDSARFNAKHRAFFMAEGEEAIRRAHGGKPSQGTHDDEKRRKLEAMAHQTASPNEAKVAEHMLFKRYGHKPHA